MRRAPAGDGIDYQNVQDLPPWLQLVRVVASWDNLAGVPLGQRSWDGRVCASPNSAMSPHLVASRNPYTGKIFALFLDRDGSWHYARARA